MGRGEDGKQKTRVRGWTGIGRNRWIGEDDKLKENVCIASLKKHTVIGLSEFSFFLLMDSFLCREGSSAPVCR